MSFVIDKVWINRVAPPYLDVCKPLNEWLMQHTGKTFHQIARKLIRLEKWEWAAGFLHPMLSSEQQDDWADFIKAQFPNVTAETIADLDAVARRKILCYGLKLSLQHMYNYPYNTPENFYADHPDNVNANKEFRRMIEEDKKKIERMYNERTIPSSN